VFALQDVLPTLTAASFVSFHENLAIATRDKNAAYFAQPDGAQMLVCSEIGSEGRNFQFAHHLVLFDLPLDPSVLEQRIGRLDRIGQKTEIHIHIPYLLGTAHEIVFRWYHEGLNAFRDTVLGADTFHEALIGKLLAVCRQSLLQKVRESNSAVEALIAETRTLAVQVKDTLEKGRDRLLEINSNKASLATDLIQEIRAEDVDVDLEEYLEEVFDHFGLDTEKTAVRRGTFVFPGERMLLDSFPCVPETGLALTYDRGEALIREDTAFMSMDHPLVRSAVDLLLEGQEGTVGFVEWRNAPHSGIAVEAVFILTATAPGALHLDRFLPPTPIRILVDEKGESLNHLLKAMNATDLEMAPLGLLEENNESFERLVPRLVEAAHALAAIKVSGVKKQAHAEAEQRLGAERDRLRDLRALNQSVS
jgi:ATP-dependent helicase HepA